MNLKRNYDLFTFIQWFWSSVFVDESIYNIINNQDHPTMVDYITPVTIIEIHNNHPKCDDLQRTNVVCDLV